MIQTLSEPCWYLADPTGAEYDNGDGTPHFATNAEARSYARDNLGRDDLTPYQFARPCVIATCNGCGEDPDDDTWGTVHFDDETSARDALPVYDFRAEPDSDKAWCDGCDPTKYQVTR